MFGQSQWSEEEQKRAAAPAAPSAPAADVTQSHVFHVSNVGTSGLLLRQENKIRFKKKKEEETKIPFFRAFFVGCPEVGPRDDVRERQQHRSQYEPLFTRNTSMLHHHQVKDQPRGAKRVQQVVHHRHTLPPLQQDWQQPAKPTRRSRSGFRRCVQPFIIFFKNVTDGWPVFYRRTKKNEGNLLQFFK